MSQPKVRIGIVESRFQADCIAASVKSMPEEAEVIAVASSNPGNAETFARKHDPELGHGRLVHPAKGKTSVTVTTRVTDNGGKTGSASRTFAISPVGDGQLLTPTP